MERDSTSFIIKEMQIKTTTGYHLTTVRVAKLKKKKSPKNKCRRVLGENGIMLCCWWGCKLVQPLWRRVWRFLKKVNIVLPCDPAIPLPGLAPKTILI